MFSNVDSIELIIGVGSAFAVFFAVVAIPLYLLDK